MGFLENPIPYKHLFHIKITVLFLCEYSLILDFAELFDINFIRDTAPRSSDNERSFRRTFRNVFYTINFRVDG